MNKYVLILYLFLLGCHEKTESFISLSDNIIAFGWKGETKEITICSNEHWEMTSKLPDWISVNYKQKDNISNLILITVSNNETNNTRFFESTFAISDKEVKLLITQSDKDKLTFVGSKEYYIKAEGTELSIDIEHNINYETRIIPDEITWINQQKSINTLSKSSDNKNISMWNDFFKLIISANPKNEKRHAKVVIYNENFHLSDTLYITQEANEKPTYLDGDFLQLQQTTCGNANLIIMGDGFTSKEFAEEGNYEHIMRQAMEYFFSIEPFYSYREYFNVYTVFAHSEEEGVSENNLFGKVNNKFSSTYGNGTEITCNNDLIFEYARKIKELPTEQPITVLVVLNSTKYAGTAYLYSDGNSIALCPMSDQKVPNDFEGIIHHEAGGHAFGFLCDEYIYYEQEMPESRKKDLQEWQKLGFQTNLDFTDDLSQIRWKDFIGMKNYENVGAYEGGYEYKYGVWRSEENSCMNNNIPYFNIQSRWSIVNRIMQLSQKTFTLDEFIQKDHPTYPQGRNAAQTTTKHIPLGTPQWIMIK